jgi:hypothetical protein
MALLEPHPAIVAYLRDLPPKTPERLVTEKRLRRLSSLSRELQLDEAARVVRQSLTVARPRHELYELRQCDP